LFQTRQNDLRNVLRAKTTLSSGLDHVLGSCHLSESAGSVDILGVIPLIERADATNHSKRH
jgi:hypothetical protein